MFLWFSESIEEMSVFSDFSSLKSKSLYCGEEGMEVRGKDEGTFH